MKPTTKKRDVIRIQRISYFGNQTTSRHKNNVRIYIQPYFDSSDVLTIIDLKKRIKHTKCDVFSIDCGKYTYQRMTDSMFSEHTGKDCMLIPLSKKSIMPKGSMNKYLISSNTN
ncbi:MAG TPA: hypothetical protein VL854_05680, partial [Nitrososphaeraceae archaeon]|nr:hypothetical protein [Nitrososphaeraceae archaeon]